MPRECAGHRSSLRMTESTMFRQFWSDLAHAPRPALCFGLGGLIPFMGLTGLAITGSAVGDHDARTMLAEYGATILSFVGALHWAYAVKDQVTAATAWRRYGWSVLPALMAFGALQWASVVALRIEAATLVLALWVDRRLYPQSGLPRWMLALRTLLTTIVAGLLMLAAVF